jgi:hypothetical protein
MTAMNSKDNPTPYYARDTVLDRPCLETGIDYQDSGMDGCHKI